MPATQVDHEHLHRLTMVAVKSKTFSVQRLIICMYLVYILLCNSVFITLAWYAVHIVPTRNSSLYWENGTQKKNIETTIKKKKEQILFA